MKETKLMVANTYIHTGALLHVLLQALLVENVGG